MLVQEKGRLKKMQDHSLHLTFHDGTSSSKTKPSKKNKKDKTLLKVCKGQIHKKKCFFYNKAGHFKKDCPIRNKQFEKKGTYYVSICFKSNLIEVPNNNWWLDSGVITHVSHVMQGFLSIQPIRGTGKVLVYGKQNKGKNRRNWEVQIDP